jgi:hypothetical protein
LRSRRRQRRDCFHRQISTEPRFRSRKRRVHRLHKSRLAFVQNFQNVFSPGRTVQACWLHFLGPPNRECSTLRRLSHPHISLRHQIHGESYLINANRSDMQGVSYAVGAIAVPALLTLPSSATASTAFAVVNTRAVQLPASSLHTPCPLVDFATHIFSGAHSLSQQVVPPTYYSRPLVVPHPRRLRNGSGRTREKLN